MSDNVEKIVQDFIELTSIDAVSYDERRVADKIKELLSSIGIDSYEDDAAKILDGTSGNIYATFHGDADIPPIMLSAHMDTVGPGKSKRPIVDKTSNTITSDGTTVLGSDDIAGVIEIIEGVRRVIASGKSHRTVELLFTVAEEVYTKGAAAFDYSKLTSKEAYCLDLSGDVGGAAIKAPTLISYKVTVNGKASHAGFAPDEGINAILAAAEAISKIKQGQVDEESTVNIGTIKGGVATNIVSEECECAGEIRSYSHDKALSLLKSVEESFLTAAKKHDATIDFTYEVHFKAYEVTQDDSVVKRFDEACALLGIGSRHVNTFGGADNHQFNAHGIKGIVLSCGMENVHTTDEYIKIDNLINGAKLVEKLITIE